MNDIPDDKNRRVLVIDDNRAIHDDFRKILSPATAATAALDATETAVFGHLANAVQGTQFEIESAYQGQEGMLLVKKALEAGLPYAMAFVDVRMPPGWDGVETTRRIWELDPNLQVVLCTAYSDYSWDEMFEKLGHRDSLFILKKPFDAVEAFELAYALTEKWWLHKQSVRRVEELESRVIERTHELQQSNRTLQAEVAKYQRAEESLRLLSSAVEQSKESILITDAQLDLPGPKILFVNPAFTQMTGYTSEEAIGRTPRILQGPRTDKTVLKRLRHDLQEGQTFAGEAVNYRKDGEEFDMEWQIAPICNPSGKTTHFVAIQRDITERKRAQAELERAEEKLRDAEANYRGLFENAIEGIYQSTPDGRYLTVNAALARMYGYERPEEMTGEVSDIQKQIYVDPACRERFKQEIESAGIVRGFEYQVRRRDGSALWISESARAVRGPDGTVSHYEGFIEDINPRKRYEAKLFQSQKMETVGKLAGGIAHEFNSILTAIIGQSELLRNDLPAESPLAKNVLEITRAAGRATTLTRQLLAYGRKQILQPETLDLNQVIASMEGTFHHLMGVDIKTHIVPAAGLQAVKADAGQIEQVIMNMAINAREAMPNGGQLTLETANVSIALESVGHYPELKAGDYVMLAITDTGAGMSDEVKARLFEPFFSTKAVGQGTGLGLSTCYGIIKQSGGHISVYSEIGRGATFKIYLPQVEQQARIPVQRLDSQELPRGTETILLVEDDPALREMASTLLRRLGYTVWAAANGVEALSLKQQRNVGHIDLLFTDVVMPHMSGKELADRVEALYPHTRILFTSAYTENAIVHQGVLDKGVALLQKPFTPSALANKLREVLDQRGAPTPEIGQETFGFAK
jgi:PAS domain S-box-containing protein